MAASGQSITTTEYVDRALRSALHANCNTCGRSSAMTALPPGFTPAFESWLAEMKRVNPNGIVIITTLEEGTSYVYWARIRHESQLAGEFMIDVLFDRHGRSSHPLGLPRGTITGWREDYEGRWYENHRVLGYEDGNVFVRNQLIALKAREQGLSMPTPSRRRPR